MVKAIFFLFTISIILFLMPLYLNWQQSLLDMHAFRQTQTAISVQYMLQGGALLGYETPILGAPWKFPQEFPIYQWNVVLAYLTLPVSLDQAGRLINWCSFLLILWPLRVIVRRLGGDSTLFYILGTLLLCSPMYAFWSQTFMIESTALLLSVSFVAILLVYLDKPTFSILAILVVIASLAALVKITTYVAFVGSGGLLVMHDFYLRHQTVSWKSLALRYAGVAVAMSISLLLLSLWVYYADALKSQSLMGSMRTSTALKYWYSPFSTDALDVLISRAFWKVFFTRMLPEIFGIFYPLWVICFVFLWIFILARRAYMAAGAVVVLVILFFVPLILFPNLHFYHNYYQFANALFLIAAASVLLWQLYKIASPLLATFVLSMMMVLAIVSFIKWFYPAIISDKTLKEDYQIATFIKNNTPEDSIVMALGVDWSSVIPYYAQRRGILISDYTPATIMETFIQSPNSVTGGRIVSSFVDCPHAEMLKDPEQQVTVEALQHKFTAGMQMQKIGNCQIFFRQ